ncbi:hypothetical protein SEA_BABYDOTZ_93 [Microbacterium phage BabyDotz]|nr:hypothetical protein SEA_BABYDOTZ_93 [Microbacterium phage BabyDotz]
MSAHTECGRVGKFDCDADEYVMATFLDSGTGEGNVEGPVAWFGEVYLEPVDEAPYVEHYGTSYLIAREFNDGRVAVETYATEEMQQERLSVLREAHDQWELDVFTD